MRRARCTLAAWLVLLSWQGCGSDDDGGGPNGNSEAGGVGATAGSAGSGGSGGGSGGGTGATGGSSGGTGATGGSSGGTGATGGSSGGTGATGGSAGAAATGGTGGSAGAGGGSLQNCPAFTTGNAFSACTGTYLTSDSEDHAGGVDIAPDGAVVYGGSLHDGDYNLTAAQLLGGGNAGVLRLSPDGRQPLSVTRIGSAVRDLQVHHATGRIAVAGSFGVAVLDPTAAAVVWSDDLGAQADRVAVGQDGTVAALTGKSVTVFDASGTELGAFSVSTNQSVNDIALDSNGQTVFAVGYKQDDGYTCTQLQIPFLRACDYQGGSKWTAYDWNKTQVGDANECADTRAYAVAMGRDGKLYYAGESHGGNTVHRRMPNDLSTSAPNEKFDDYSDPFNMNGAAPIGYVARFDPGTGVIEAGQMVVTRLSSGKGNAARPRSVAADAAGHVVVGGASACCIEGGADKTINGLPAMPGYAGGGFVMVLSPDFKSRLQWTAFNGDAGSGALGVGVAAGGGAMAVLMHQDTDPDPTTSKPLLTFDALLPDAGGGHTDAYLSVWRAPD